MLLKHFTKCALLFIKGWIVCYSLCLNAQTSLFYFTPEILAGYTAPSNGDFPDRGLQTQLHLHLTKENTLSTKEWAHWLKAPRTGISIGYTNFGNNKLLGSAFTILPYLSFTSFKNKKLQTEIGLGASYFTTQFDPITNPDNRAITTDFTWSFKAFMKYAFLTTEKATYKAGLGLFHHSNGHTRLPNNGYNSFLVSFSAAFKKKDTDYPHPNNLTTFEKTRYQYLAIRTGIGQNIFNDGFAPFNRKKEVYTLSAEYGRVYNKTLKLGVGGFYRFYEHYYDYINNNEFLVQEGQRYASYTENPWRNATNIALYIKGELLLNHIGIELLVGANLYKPGYKLDWYLNDGYDNAPRVPPGYWKFGNFNSKYEFKQAITTRLGIKYYLNNTDTPATHNYFIGAFLNTNLGQADSSELGFGYVYSFGLKRRD